MFKEGFVILIPRMCIMSFKIMILLLVVDILTIGSILRNGVENPNWLYKLICMINLGKLCLYRIELEIMKLTHYIVE